MGEGLKRLWTPVGGVSWLRRVALALGLCLVLTACGAPDPLAEMVAGEQGRVVRIIDGDALVLDTGQSVRLVSIEAPAPERRDRPGAPYADDASRELEDLALGREVRLYYAGLTRDRYDRALAHAVTIDSLGPEYWLNAELVARGAARVRVYPDTARGAAPLLELEAGAREQRIGLWALPDYDIPRAGDVPSSARGFMVVSGVLGQRRPVPERRGDERDRWRPAASCIRELLSSRLELRVLTSSAVVCAYADGERIQARGYVRDGSMEISHGLNIALQGRTDIGSDNGRQAGAATPSTGR